MKILVSGANGFVGKNLTVQLKNESYDEVFTYDKDSKLSSLETYCKEADFVYHLAGVNRPRDDKEYMEGNFGFTVTLLDTLKKYNNSCPIMMASSVQAVLDNPYGKSKKAAEDLMFRYSKETGAKVLLYRFPNLFGKWCKPNYNSVVATFCNNIARDLPVTINNPNGILNLTYIDDVVEELINSLHGKENKNGDFCEVPIVYSISLEELATQINSFKDSRVEQLIPIISNTFTKKLFSTYLSYLPDDTFSTPLKMNIDNRGSFTEFIRSATQGQISVNISKPGIIKGNHWHHTKHEKFLVVCGTGVIKLRNIDSDKVIKYYVSDEKLEVVDIPTGYTHNIQNLGNTDMVTIMWANECFDAHRPDTYYLQVSTENDLE